MSVRLRKHEIKRLLAERNYERLASWASTVRTPMRTLISLTYDPDELIRWRAIEAVGLLSVTKFAEEPEKVRDVIRRLLWLMNDESGGLGWHCPEIIGEVLVNVPELVPEYGNLLPSFIDEEPFERGTWHAISRLSANDSKLYSDHTEKMIDALKDSDPQIRVFAALTLEKVIGNKAREQVSVILKEDSEIKIYDFRVGHLLSTSVAVVVADILKRLDTSEAAV